MELSWNPLLKTYNNYGTSFLVRKNRLKKISIKIHIMKFDRVVEGDRIASKSGMFIKLKWDVLTYILKHHNVYRFKHRTENFERYKYILIKELIQKIDDDEFRKILKKIKLEYVQHCHKDKFYYNQLNALEKNLIRYEKWEINPLSPTD